MLNKFNFMVSVLGLCTLSLQAQTINAPGYTETLVSTGASGTIIKNLVAGNPAPSTVAPIVPNPGPVPYAFPVNNTSVAIQGNGINDVKISAWDGEVINELFSSGPGSAPSDYANTATALKYEWWRDRDESYIEWRAIAGGIIPLGPIALSSTYIPNGGIIPTNGGFMNETHLSDPDIAFSEDYTAFFVAYVEYTIPNMDTYGAGPTVSLNGTIGASRIILQKWILNGPTYQLNSYRAINTQGGFDVNIDYTHDNVAGTGRGIMTWQENDIRVVEFDLNLSTPMIPINIGSGRYADVALTTGSSNYYISYKNVTNGNAGMDIDIAKGTWTNTGVTPPTTLYTSSGFQYIDYPRIACPRDLNTPLNTDQCTVVSGTAFNNGAVVRGMTHNAGTTTNYTISINPAASSNMNPVVCYSLENIKCMWVSDYFNTGTGWIDNSGTVRQDILLSEIDPVNYSPINHTFFEINNDPLGTDRYVNGLPALAESATDVSSTVNMDYNAFLYYPSNVNINGDFPLYNKAVPNTANNKRQGISQEDNISLSIAEQEYILEGSNLTHYAFSLSNINGQQIDISNQMDISEDMIIINGSSLKTGIYFLNCLSAKETKTFKLMVK